MYLSPNPNELILDNITREDEVNVGPIEIDEGGHNHKESHSNESITWVSRNEGHEETGKGPNQKSKEEDDPTMSSSLPDLMRPLKPESGGGQEMNDGEQRSRHSSSQGLQHHTVRVLGMGREELFIVPKSCFDRLGTRNVGGDDDGQIIILVQLQLREWLDRAQILKRHVVRC